MARSTARALSKRDSTACDAINFAARKLTMSTRPLTTGWLRTPTTHPGEEVLLTMYLGHTNAGPAN
jgi:hypothetical protein